MVAEFCEQFLRVVVRYQARFVEDVVFNVDFGKVREHVLVTVGLNGCLLLKILIEGLWRLFRLINFDLVVDWLQMLSLVCLHHRVFNSAPEFRSFIIIVGLHMVSGTVNLVDSKRVHVVRDLTRKVDFNAMPTDAVAVRCLVWVSLKQALTVLNAL